MTPTLLQISIKRTNEPIKRLAGRKRKIYCRRREDLRFISRIHGIICYISENPRITQFSRENLTLYDHTNQYSRYTPKYSIDINKRKKYYESNC